MKIPEFFTNKLIEMQIISSKDEDIYLYGFCTLLTKLVSFSTILALSFGLGIMKEVILVLVFLVPLRRFAGGIHSSSPKRCFAYSVMLALSNGIILHSYNMKMMFLNFLVVIGLFVIVVFSPCDSESRLLNTSQKKKYKKLSRYYAIILTMIYAVMTRYGLRIGASAIGVAFADQGVLTILSVIKKLISKQRKTEVKV